MVSQLYSSEYEFFRPLVQGWVAKLEASKRSRSKWEEVADECLMFYSKSAAAMWDKSYTRRFWKGVQEPRFRVTINKAFELIAIFGPNLLWEVPHRTVEPKKPLEIPPEIFGDLNNPQVQQFHQQVMSQYQMEHARDRARAFLMDRWLNYTPREMPGGGLARHSELAVMDALIKGRGCLWTRPYNFPGSGRTLTGCFREPPDNLFIDPDYNTMDDAKWIAIRRVQPTWEVERKFQLPEDSLKGRATFESAWNYGEASSDPNINMHRQAGNTNDLLVYYEIFSKTGTGARLTGMHHALKSQLDEVVGDYAYIVVSPSVPYPLNCTSHAVRNGDSTSGDIPINNDELRNKFSWPIPYWADDKWPVEVLDFYPDPDSSWPIPPLAPALGELKFLNIMLPHAMNRIWSSSRDFWAVYGPAKQDLERHLKEGGDQTIIPISQAYGKSVNDVVQILQQPQTNFDVWKILDAVFQLFDKRTGLTDLVYGENPGGTQPRSATESQSKERATGVRPEHMRKKVVEWQSNAAGSEGFCTRWFVKGDDIVDFLGPTGKMLWDSLIMSEDVERVVRQLSYTVSASSIRRPNRDRDIVNVNQALQTFAPALQAFGQSSGNYDAFNYLMKKWGELSDIDMEPAQIVVPPPDPQQQQAQQQQMQLEMARLQADVEKTKMDAQKAGAEAQATAAEAQGASADIQGKQSSAMMDMMKERMGMQQLQQKSQMDLQQTEESHKQSIRHDEVEHLLDMAQGRAKHEQTMKQQDKMGDLKMQLARKMARAKPATNGSK